MIDRVFGLRIASVVFISFCIVGKVFLIEFHIRMISNPIRKDFSKKKFQFFSGQFLLAVGAFVDSFPLMLFR